MQSCSVVSFRNLPELLYAKKIKENMLLSTPTALLTKAAGESRMGNPASTAGSLERPGEGGAEGCWAVTGPWACFPPLSNEPRQTASFSFPRS